MNKFDTAAIWMVLGICIGLLIARLALEGCGLTYKHGQIDALTGKVKYRLVPQDSTWERIEP